MIQYDTYNLRYLSKLPEDAKAVKSIWEFVIIDPGEFDYYRMKEGKLFAIYSQKMERYEVYEVNRYMCEPQLAPYIKQERVFWLPS